jgi:hypothetical protein
MVHTNPESLWNKTIKPMLEKKRAYRLDAWGAHLSKECEDVINPLVKWIDSVAPQANATYPTPWGTERHVMRAITQTFMSATFSDEFANLFKDFSMEDLEKAARNFHFDECVLG